VSRETVIAALNEDISALTTRLKVLSDFDSPNYMRLWNERVKLKGYVAELMAMDPQIAVPPTSFEVENTTIVMVLNDVMVERRRQIAKWGVQHRDDDTGGGTLRIAADRARAVCQAEEKHVPGGAGWRAVLGEEVAEAFAESDEAALEKELVQVAAVAVAWIEDLRSRRAAVENGGEAPDALG
jgi:hypothetical protein